MNPKAMNYTKKTEFLAADQTRKAINNGNIPGTCSKRRDL